MLPKISDIKVAAAEYFGVSIDDLEGPSRTKKVARPRMIAMLVCVGMTGRSSLDIALYFGGRDHTTILSAIKRINALEQKNKAIAKSLIDVPLIAARVCLDRRERNHQLVREALATGQIRPLMVAAE